MSYTQALALMNKGRSNPSDYQIILPQSVALLSPDGNIQDYLRFFCRAVTLPGITHNVTQLRNQENVGIARNVMTGKTYGSPVVMTFSERSDLVIYSTLKRWMDTAFIGSEQLNRNSRSLRANFHDNVTNDVIIQKLEPINDRVFDNNRDVSHKVVAQYTLINALPLAMEQVTMSLESADSLLDFTISLAFESFNYVNFSEDTVISAGASLARQILG
ncbi:hypothetical protein OAL32_00325 [Synechococcus sp. AH-551-G15]|nr:hypothetical protein [Synechococcus sp. AH-551-G15]